MKTACSSQQPASIDRRTFIRWVSSSAGGIVVGTWIPNPLSAEFGDGSLRQLGHLMADQTDANAFSPGPYLTILSSGDVIITVHRTEMGQGIRSALAMCLVEELDADWSSVRIQQADGDFKYGDQVTGGSASISGSAMTFRRLGATARMLLISAAASAWGIEPARCTTQAGRVIGPADGQELGYGEVAGVAALIDAQSLPDAQLKESDEFRLIGTRIGNWDATDIVTGRAIYGTDVRVPGMLFATIARPPVNRGSVVSYDDTGALAVRGVRAVVPISSGLAVVADNSWSAIKGREALAVEWDDGSEAKWTSTTIRDVVLGMLPPSEPAPNQIEALYEMPFEAHGPMEPMNATADVRPNETELWAPTQAPFDARLAVASAIGQPVDKIQVHVPLVGGGFGRRLEVDYAVEAAELSQALAAPVQVLWTREDDIKHDFLHPMTLGFRRAKLNEPFSDHDLRNGASMLGPRTGAWRAVDNVPDALSRECFIDEFAAAVGKDPYLFRLELIGQGYSPKIEPALRLAAEKAGWGAELPARHGRGIAVHSTWSVTHVAVVMEVAVGEAGEIRIDRVVCAVDCGLVINPSGVEAQIEGGVVFALTAALKDGITIDKGRVQQSNFHDFRLLRFDEMPPIEVHTVPSDREPSGIGEMGVPPTIPALLNAIFSATGKRIRAVPIRPEDLAIA